MLIKFDVFADIVSFLSNSIIASYLEDALIRNHCATLEDARYLASNTRLAIDNMLTGPSKKQYVAFEDLKNDLSRLKKSIDEGSHSLDEFQVNGNYECKKIVDSVEFKEVLSSLYDIASEVNMYCTDHYYDVYNL